jgi:hypothetical protein
MSLLLVLITVLGLVPAFALAADAETETEGFSIDFKEVAKAASEQAFWDDLASVTTQNGYETKRVGNIVRGTAMTDSQRTAYGELRTWLDDTYGWTINEGASYFDYASGGNRLYLCADDDVAWGMSLNTYYRNYALALDVTVPAAGEYELEMVISKTIKGNRDFPVDGWETTQGGYIEVLVNGRSARQFCSQGQVRTSAISLKLAQRELMATQSGEIPVLLLDDVLSELDPGRQDFVLNQITEGQVFITCCEPGRFTKLGKTIEIHHAQVV